MVLTRRSITLVALFACTTASVTSAQRARGGGRGRSDGPRPLLFGFALECERCESSSPRGLGAGPMAVWHYSEFPRVVAVATGGSAARAGIRENDLVMSVDGLSLLTDEGAQRFSALRMGDDVRLSLDRGGKLIDVTLVLGSRVTPRDVRGQAPPPDGPTFSGRAGSSAVDVWSESPVSASTDSTGALVLRIGETTVRVRPPSPLPQPRKP